MNQMIPELLIIVGFADDCNDFRVAKRLQVAMRTPEIEELSGRWSSSKQRRERKLWRSAGPNANTTTDIFKTGCSNDRDATQALR